MTKQKKHSRGTGINKDISIADLGFDNARTKSGKKVKRHKITF